MLLLIICYPRFYGVTQYTIASKWETTLALETSSSVPAGTFLLLLSVLPVDSETSYIQGPSMQRVPANHEKTSQRLARR